MSSHPPSASPLRDRLRTLQDGVERAFDRPFGQAGNPWRQLGALAYLLFWIVAATGIYVYIGFDTRADGAYASVERLSANEFPLGSLTRTLHRYASDAFVVVVLLHLLREWLHGHYAHFRRFSWMTGVVTVWLLMVSGIGGFWLVWDRLAQYSLIATTEWLDALPVFDGALIRNFIAPDAVNDRLFSLLIFLHIGFPLALLAVMWIHLQRLSRPASNPPRALAWGTLGALVLLSLVRPVASDAPADLTLAPTTLALDWFYLGVHAFADVTSQAALWVATGGFTLLLLALPWLSHAARAPRPLVAVVDPALCAGCGICAGACPSSTPFRSVAELVTGIDMPQAPVHALRTELEVALAKLAAAGPDGGAPRVVVFGCHPAQGGPDLARIADERTATLSLLCAAQLPPSFVEFALRAGAEGVLVTGCRDGDCMYRLGNQWTEERLAGVREPHLRTAVPRDRVRVAWAGRQDSDVLATALAAFRASLATAAAQDTARIAPPKRVTRRPDPVRSA